MDETKRRKEDEGIEGRKHFRTDRFLMLTESGIFFLGRVIKLALSNQRKKPKKGWNGMLSI